jgi:hypothetical protein
MLFVAIAARKRNDEMFHTVSFNNDAAYAALFSPDFPFASPPEV